MKILYVQTLDVAILLFLCIKNDFTQFFNFQALGDSILAMFWRDDNAH